MKKITFLLLTLISTVSFGQTTDLFFSMYGEGGGQNKFLEIYNGSGENVDLSIYTVELYTNGSATATGNHTFEEGEILNDGEVIVLKQASADAAIPGIASPAANFNGDDAIALLKNDVIVDVIGQIGVDPGSGWTVGSTENGTVNHTLIRKPDVCTGNVTPLNSFGTDEESSEWIVSESDTQWDAIGSHTANCDTNSITKNSKNAFVMYPNPTSTGKVSIKTLDGTPVNVAVFDVLGKKIVSKTLNNNELNVSGLKTGVYLVQVTQNGATTTKKLIVE